MRIIIAGDGKLGSSLARQLSAEGNDITIIDYKEGVLEDSEERYDVMVVSGNCVSKDVLMHAGVKESDLLIAVAEADEVNLLCCMTAHTLNPNLHTIARVRNPEYTQQVYEMRSQFALSMIVNPERQAAVEIANLLKYPGFLQRDTFAKGRVEIVELRVDADSKLCNVPLSSIQEVVKCKVLVCAVLRDGEAVAPDGGFVLQEGDHIFVTAMNDTLAVLLKNLGIVTHKVKNVMICGGGRISYYLVKLLEKNGLNLQIIEKDRERCEELAAILPDVDITHGDVSSQFLLDSQGIKDVDALITLTGLDELNMMVSLFGERCGVAQVITKLGRLDSTGILGDLSIGSVVNPGELCRNRIVRYVRAMNNQVGAAKSIHRIADGQMEALEFVVEAATPHCGVPLKDIKLKKGVLIASIAKGAQIDIAHGGSSYAVGDTLVVVTDKDKTIYHLNEIFE